MNLNKALAFLSLLILPALVACGGGGGGSSSVPSTNSGTTTGGGSTATSAPTPTPTPTLSATGTVKDLGTHNYTGDSGSDGPAIAGATVVIGPTLINGATPPPTLPTGDVSAVTSATGSYTANGFSGSGTTYVMVFPQTADSHVSLHGLANISNGTVRGLYLYSPTSIELSELAQINSDRTTNGAGTVILDELAMETARASATFKATNGYYQHCIPATLCAVLTTVPSTSPASYAPQYASPDDLYNSFGGALSLQAQSNQTENYYINWPGNGTLSNWASADAYFMAEKIQTPQGLHYLNIINTAHLWTGLGGNTNGLAVPFNGAPTGASNFAVFVQEFYSPTGGV